MNRPASARSLLERTAAFVIIALLVGLALRVAWLSRDRFHADEALYAGWALRILDDDPLLLDVPVDKPPLYLYLLSASLGTFGRSEVAARLPNLAASTVNLALLYLLGKRLYGPRTARWALLFGAFAPMSILFARTAFTDTLLVTWMLVALCAVSADCWFWAGVALSLACATKQHATVLVPLVLTVGCVKAGMHLVAGRRLRACGARLLRGSLGFLGPFALVTWWDAQRWATRPGYWQQSAESYGGLAWAAPAEWGDRLLDWLRWGRYLVGSPLLYALLFLGGAFLLARGICSFLRKAHRRASGRCPPASVASRSTPSADEEQRSKRLRERPFDTILAAYALAYLVLHTVLAFSVWDRYLLPLVPVVSLLLARTVSQGLTALEGMPGLRALREGIKWILLALVCLTMLTSGVRAAGNGYPVGGEHWAYQGLDEVVAYLRENAAPDAVLYHHWLRWHYTYYLYDSGYELRWWQSGEHLEREVLRTPGREQYIVLPDWRTLDPDAPGVVLEPLYEAHRADGSTSLQLYRVRPADNALGAQRRSLPCRFGRFAARRVGVGVLAA